MSDIDDLNYSEEDASPQKDGVSSLGSNAALESENTGKPSTQEEVGCSIFYLYAQKQEL